MSLPMLKAPGVISEVGHIHTKAFSGRFGFDDVRTSQTLTVRQEQSNGNAPWRCSIRTHYLYSVLCYIHRRGVFSVAQFGRTG